MTEAATYALLFGLCIGMAIGFILGAKTLWYGIDVVADLGTRLKRKEQPNEQ